MREHRETTRVGGAWLAAASLAMIASLALHGPIPGGIGERMVMIAERHAAWTVAHWIAAIGLSLHVGAGLIILTAGSRLTRRGWALTAWTALTLGALWTLTTAVAEATAITDAALAGDADLFAAWWSFAEGRANGFALAVLAMAVIARHDALAEDPLTPAWAAHTGSLAGLGAFAGWALSMWLDVPAASMLWVGAAILVSGWTLWLGVALARTRSSSGISAAAGRL